MSSTSLLFVGLLVTMPLRLASGLLCPSDLDAQVLVFGGGVTGLTVARQLYDSGITDVKVLEARSDKVGGRIRSTTFAGATIELGANWIQEVFRSESKRDLQPIWKLAKDTPGCVNLTGHFTEKRQFWDRDRQGKYTVVDRKVVELAQEKYDAANTKIEKLSRWLQENDLDDIDVKRAFEFEGYFPSTPIDNVTEWLNYDFQVALSPALSSLVTTFPYDNGSLGTRDYFISDQRGYSSFLSCITQGIESKIHLSTMVNNISWNDDCVCASITVNGGEQQSSMCGKYGVVTFSIGVLQDWIRSNDQLKFNPQLSLDKRFAIYAHKMGYYLKIFLQFNVTFWNSSFDDILRTDLRKNYFPMISPLGQLLPGSPGVLFVTVVESEAYRLSIQDHEQTKQEIMTVLRQLYGDDIPDPIDMLIPSWIQDPLYKGMYSVCPIGLKEDDKLVLRQPEGNLYLSGEALSVSYYGFVHGGYCEGLRTAKNILTAEQLIVKEGSLPPCP